MDNPESRKELAEKVLVHLYNSAVTGSLRSTALLLGMKNDKAWVESPGYQDLRALYELAGKDRRLFYSAATALSEFEVYSVLYFVEKYSRFDSRDNKEDFPQVSLVYTNATAEGLQSVTLSEHGTEELGMLFKRIARSKEMRSLVEKVVDQLAAINPSAGKVDEQKKG